MFPDDLTTAVLTTALRGYNARNTAISNNIANADTPGYKRQDVSFEGALADAVAEDRARQGGGGLGGAGADATGRATDSVAPAVSSVDVTSMRVDGNGVDPDDEMARLSANALADQTVVSLLDKRFGQFMTAITGISH